MYRPFSEDNFNEFIEMVPTINGRHAPVGLPEYSILFQQIPFPSYISPEAADLIGRLLDTNDVTRLGSGHKGLQDIKSHPFFSSINWEKLEQKHMEPPFMPEARRMDENALFPSFDAMLTDFGKAQWLTELPKESDQKFFDTWYVTLLLYTYKHIHTLSHFTNLMHTLVYTLIYTQELYLTAHLKSRGWSSERDGAVR